MKTLGHSRQRVCALVTTLLCFSTFLGLCNAKANDEQAKAGAAGYAIVFHDSIITKTDFKDFPTTAMTFEAWISTSDYCHSGAIMSYALKTDSKDLGAITKAANHFVIFDVKNVIACHDFEFIDIIPDYTKASCHGHYSKSKTDFKPETGKLVHREGKWRHLAVTWDSTKKGETLIYIDGTLVGNATTGRDNIIEPHGAFMLGGEQDCYGGCTDPKQGFYGLMDEVRIWNIARKQEDIINTMRYVGDLNGKEHLVAYWKFDDPGSTGYRLSGTIKDSSGHGNDLDVLIPPDSYLVTIRQGGQTLNTGALRFKNNYAMNPMISQIPSKDITIEFWAKTGELDATNPSAERYAEFLSFATMDYGNGNVDDDQNFADSVLFDDAIRIERYLTEYNETDYLKNARVSTLGSVSVHINSNRQGNGKHNDHWLDFETKWTDTEWHHVAVTWKHATGETKLYFDGKSVVPFWRAQNGKIDDVSPSNGGVTNRIAPRTTRSGAGSLVLGQNQECYAGCFSPASSFDGSLANVRIWERVLSESEIKDGMFKNTPSNENDLLYSYDFHPEHMIGRHDRSRRTASKGKAKAPLYLGSVPPTFVYSTVPLADSSGTPVEGPVPGYMGYALELSDQQLLILKNFNNFPTNAITVEFWMLSTDGCRQGVPFSYAHGSYQSDDNSFLLFNYNDWGIAVMEDEGALEDHNAGFGSTDGKWHHIAVTWESKTGAAVLYDNGVPQWRVRRARGKTIPQGGTLVIGREQDCRGGCFDSAPGAIGDVQPVTNMEYGPQDFYGIVEEMRVWDVVRSAIQIREGMRDDKRRATGTSKNVISSTDPNLVAWWKFDEGSGYSVKDETGRGNNLRIMSDPRWVVPNWDEVCGNGVLEPTEECDDGNLIAGDGCDPNCIVETGHYCTLTSPSQCHPGPAPRSGKKPTTAPKQKRETTKRSDVKPDAPAPRPVPKVPTDDKPIPTNKAVQQSEHEEEPVVQKKKQGRSGVATFFIVLVVFALIGLIFYGAYKKRETIYEHVPGLRTVAGNIGDRVNALFGRGFHGYDLAAVDPEEAYVSPGFVDSQPPAANRAAGSVPYEPIRDSASRPAA